MSPAVTDPWNPHQYARFREERTRPFLDLLALVRPKRSMRVVDLGCGTGELTRVLHDRLSAQETLGIDRSEAMLAESARHATEGLRFVAGDIKAFQPGAPCDLILSNAALHWVGDHPALLRRLTSCLGPEGQLAVQMPANEDHPSHVIAAEVAEEQPFAGSLQGFTRRPRILAPERYATLLHRLGFREQHVRIQVYPYLLDSRESVIDWIDGTLLTPYRRRMSEAMYADFLDEIRRRLLPLLDDDKPHFYPFKRLLLWAQL